MGFLTLDERRSLDFFLLDAIFEDSVSSSKDSQLSAGDSAILTLANFFFLFFERFAVTEGKSTIGSGFMTNGGISAPLFVF
jgi:hypothetical protein